MEGAPRRELRALIVAGGTGGHLFPARYIAEAFLKANSQNKVEFIGTGRELEKKIIDSAGFTRHVIESSGVKGRGIIGLFKFLLSIPKAVLQTRKIFNSFKPDIVVGVGGYVTVIPIIFAWLKRIPTIIHEAEINPGLANLFLAHFAKRITVSFNEATIEPRIKVVVTGQPIRPEMKRFVGIKPNLPEVPKKLLIVGGSLGAKAIDDALIELAPFLVKHGISVVHQTRPENKERVQEAYSKHMLNAQVLTFIDDVASAYENSDLIIARAGASTVSELIVVNRPVILVPYPHAQGDHQTNNALILAKRGKAFIVKEGTAFPDRLRSSLEQLLDPSIYHSMVEIPALPLGISAADSIVEVAYKIA